MTTIVPIDRCPRCRGFVSRGNCINCGWDEPEVTAVLGIPTGGMYEPKVQQRCQQCSRTLRMMRPGQREKELCYVCSGKLLEAAG